MAILPRCSILFTSDTSWELLIGSLIAALELKKTLKPNNLFAFLGLAGVLIAIIFFDSLTQTQVQLYYP